MIAPYISREDVAAALSSLIHTSRKLEATGLRHLLVVDLIVMSPTMPDGDSVRDYAVRELLVLEITHALSEQRATFGLAELNERASIDAARLEAAEAVEQGALQLNAWSLLYYRYVRADLGLSVEKLAEMLTMHVRTIPRYNDEGVALLTDRLFETERKARQAQAERRLYAILPYSVPVRLLGREELLQRLHATLATLSPRHLFVTGTTGIGKSTFVQEALREEIAARNLDQLVWIDHPETVDYVRQRITEVLLREGGSVALRDYFMLYRVGLVLDGIDVAGEDRMAFEQLLNDLGAALVILINCVYIPLVGIEAHIALPELDRAAAIELVEDLLSNTEMASSGRDVESLYGHIGGNPLALRLAAGLWECGADWTLVEGELNDRLFGKLFSTFDEAAKTAWCALVLFPEGASLTTLSSLWSVTPRAVSLLRQHRLLQSTEEIYMIIGAAREYIWQQYASAQTVTVLLDQLIKRITDVDSAFEVVERALATDFPRIGSQQREIWIRTTWQEGLRRNHWTLWRTILEKFNRESGTFDAQLWIAQGICLRRLGDWADAEQIFQTAVGECGRQGWFESQARALVEWSTLVRFQGKFDRAQSYIQQAKRYAYRARDDGLMLTLSLYEAEILIQQNKGTEAYELLSPLRQNMRVLALESEAQFMIGNQERCRALALQALQLVENDRATEASLYTIIGRSFEKQVDQEQALRYLTDAVTLLERLDDLFSLARAQTNLAAALMRTQRYGDAGRLLTRAEQTQMRLGDKVGLSTTQHNRRLLARYIAR